MPEIEQETVTSSFTVGLPRSGTNFFQRALRLLAGQSALSIYSGKPAQNLKTHGLSPSYLDREMQLFGVNKIEDPLHFLIVRDPRDTVISFYDFVLAQKDINVEQAAFLSIDWFFALSHKGSAKTDGRCEFLWPLTIKDAYEAFAKHWLSALTAGTPRVRLVRYETLVRPEELMIELQSLGLVEAGGDLLAVAKNLSTTLVSQYSISPDRRRGKPFGHRLGQTRSAYNTLIQETERRLGGVIEMFGYR